MTAEEEVALLTEYLESGARIHAGFNQTVELAAAFLPVTADGIDALSVRDETTVLAFLKRFEQFEDLLGHALKAISKIMEHGKIERLTSRDVAHRAWALGILSDEKIWSDAVRTRNALAHEYPINPEKRASQVNNAWKARGTLNDTWAAILRFIETEGLLT